MLEKSDFSPNSWKELESRFMTMTRESLDFELDTNGTVFILSLQLRWRKCQLKLTRNGNLEQGVTRLITD